MKKLKSIQGNTLLTVLMSTVISSIVMFAMMRMMQTTTRGFKHAELKNDINAIKQHIINSIDCTESLQTGVLVGGTASSPLNRTTGGDCDPTSANYKLLDLKDSAGHLLGTPLVTTPGPLQNTTKMGNWNILVQCDRINHTMIVKAALVSGNSFSTDPLTKRTYDFTAANSFYLFGGPGIDAIKLCQTNLGGPTAPGFYAGASFGGSYQEYTYASATAAIGYNGSSCRIANSVLTPPSCNCPTGFLSMMVHEFSDNCSTHSYYWDTAAWGPAPSMGMCGVISRICYKTF